MDTNHDMAKRLFAIVAFCWVCIYVFMQPADAPTADCKDGTVSPQQTPFRYML